MTEKIANWIVGLFGGITGAVMGKYLVVFIISLLPILELRGGLIAATLLHLDPWLSFLISFIGNILPIPFILIFIRWIFELFKKNKFLSKFVIWCEKKAESKKEQIEKFGYWGLLIFVGVPLPGTGAWTGCLIATMLNMDKRKSAIAAVAGVLVAGVIMMILSFGILGNMIK